MKKDLTNQSIAALCLELAMLMHAGVGTGDGLALMAQEDQANEKMLNG